MPLPRPRQPLAGRGPLGHEHSAARPARGRRVAAGPANGGCLQGV